MPNTFVISVVATKGGVGKTTTSANVAGLLADFGFRVLMVDADIQPSLSKYYGLRETPTAGLSDVITRGGITHATDFVPTEIKGLDVLTSNMSDATQAWLQTRDERLFLLKRAMRQPAVRDTYDYVVIDTQGATGELQRAAAMAADLMLSPLNPSMMEYVEFQSGTLRMLDSLNLLSEFSPELRAAPLAVVINAMARDKSSNLIAEKIREDFRTSTAVRLLDTVVPNAIAYPNARALNLPVHRHDLPNNNRVTPSGHTVMHNLVYELLPNLKGMTASWGDK